MTYALVLHGGAGARPGTDYTVQKADLAKLIETGQSMLVQGQSALDVVTWAIEALEASGLYVAGKGSAPHSMGGFELDASIMHGPNRRAGAVAAIEGIKSPIQAARAVLEDGRHVMLAGTGAQIAAKAAGLAEVLDPQDYYSEHVSHGSSESADHGTVGAVALDIHGELAAGTSTGGTFNKLIGRVGDTPIIGSGTWADDTVAVSCTGLGEAFIRTATAYDVSARMRYGNVALDQATRQVLDEVARFDGDGGLIAIDAQGNISMPYNSDGMKRAAVSDRMSPVVRVFEPED
ncbi:isoaspartyl peptidase/L-asparaginase [Pseudosulfitobacter sp. SM2401]|uniref:isoaspartyl peptidase/L-asparaginase family protein n=1 Tax=Pseudosulfitobacter sp. SM2401 TaxID=3350098 RepID=UPI0036F35CB4